MLYFKLTLIALLVLALVFVCRGSSTLIDSLAKYDKTLGYHLRIQRILIVLAMLSSIVLVALIKE